MEETFNERVKRLAKDHGDEVRMDKRFIEMDNDTVTIIDNDNRETISLREFIARICEATYEKAYRSATRSATTSAQNFMCHKLCPAERKAKCTIIKYEGGECDLLDEMEDNIINWPEHVGDGEE